MKRLSMLILTILLYGTVAFSEDVTVATDKWKNYTSKDGEGFYCELLKEIFKLPKYKLKFKIVPYKRSVALINKNKVDIILGAYAQDVPKNSLLSYPIETDFVDVIVGPEIAKNWKGLNSLKNKKVVAKLGYGFEPYLKKPVKYEEKPNLLSMLKMLKKGKIDAVLDYKADINELRKKARLGKNFKIFSKVISSKVYFVFAKNRKKLQTYFNMKFKKMYQTGELSKLMKKCLGSDDLLPDFKS